MSFGEYYDTRDTYNKYDRGDDRGKDRDRGSSRDSNDIEEQIAIDTTTLKIKIKTTGDLETKEYDLIPFHPHMADLTDLSNNNYILFPYYVKITMKDLKNAGVGSDYPKIFMDLDKYIKLITYVTSPDREPDNTLIVDKGVFGLNTDENTLSTITKDEILTDEEIITNNIGLIKNLFLAPNKHFFILGNNYIIAESKYIPPYSVSSNTSKSVTDEKTSTPIPLFYTVTFELRLLDAANNPNMGDFTKLSCKAKKASIAKDSMAIFGTNFGYNEEPKVFIPSILNTSEASKTRNFGKIQRDWEERNKFMRPPRTERERIDRENKKTDLQKQMEKADKTLTEYNKIPPLWIKERKDLDKKYNAYIAAMEKLNDNYSSIKTQNPDDLDQSFVKDMLDDVTDKMSELTIEIVGDDLPTDPTEKENTLKAFIVKLVGTKELNKKIDDPGSITGKAKKKEKEAIDEKYVTPFLAETGELVKDIKAIEEREKGIKTKLELLYKSPTPENLYSAQTAKEELRKVQEELVKKRATKATKDDAKEIIKKWEKALYEKEKTMNSIEKTKEKDDLKNKKKTVNVELKKKMDEIHKAEKELLLAFYTEGNYDELSSDEKKYFERKGERSLESSTDLNERITNLKKEYIDIAKKIGDEQFAKKTLAYESTKHIDELIKKKERDYREYERLRSYNSQDRSAIDRRERDRKRDNKELTPADQAKRNELERDKNKLDDKLGEIYNKLKKLKQDKERIKDENKAHISFPGAVNKVMLAKAREKIEGGYGKKRTIKKRHRKRQRKTKRHGKKHNLKTMRRYSRRQLKKYTRRHK